jgi:hypothetical protein
MPEPQLSDNMHPIPDNQIEVNQPALTEGKVEVMTKGGWMNPPPRKLKVVCESIIYFCAGLITTVSATDIFSGGQAKIISFVLGVVMLAAGAIQKGIGVVPDGKY